MTFLGFGKKKEESQSKDDQTQAEKTKKDSPVKTEPEKATLKKTVTKETAATVSSTDLTGIIIRPRITEKAAVIAEERNVYTFDVYPEATKKEIGKAVEDNYKVKPVKINITPVKSKKVFSRGKIGKKAGGKKAMVYLKKGDKIEFV